MVRQGSAGKNQRARRGAASRMDARDARHARRRRGGAFSLVCPADAYDPCGQPVVHVDVASDASLRRVPRRPSGASRAARGTAGQMGIQAFGGPGAVDRGLHQRPDAGAALELVRRGVVPGLADIQHERQDREPQLHNRRLGDDLRRHLREVCGAWASPWAQGRNHP